MLLKDNFISFNEYLVFKYCRALFHYPSLPSLITLIAFEFYTEVALKASHNSTKIISAIFFSMSCHYSF